ncbi:hypothetical protein Cgig2_000647 [Carnegiea gigantea]|uniref:Uncharacterized protein n=1 Tax=Carnegiea gigantea TaxID=171969 RepID=A0A9Q1GN06_9CARY|nr:hypothetical protein Cgig2_000647 [Carnegiea gigantea]
MEIVATIAGRYTERITRSAWKAQLQGAQQVLTAKSTSTNSQKGSRKEENQNPRGLDVGRHGLLIVQAALNSSRWIKLHQLRILTLGSGLAAIFYVLNVRFKIALYAERVRRQGQQKLPKELGALVMTPALSEPPLAGTLSASSWPPGPSSPYSSSPSSACTQPLPLLTFGAQPEGH